MRTAALALLSLVAVAHAQDPLAQDGYLQPPKPIMDAALAPWWQNVTPSNYSPDGKNFLVLVRDGLPSLASLAKPHRNLAGLDVDTVARRERSMTTRSAKALKIVEIEHGDETVIPIPASARVSDPVWGPKSDRVAFLVHLPDRTEAWTYDVNSKKAARATAAPLLATASNDLHWLEDNRLVVVLALDRPAPAIPEVAPGPRVALTETKKPKLYTHASLLGSTTDAEQLEYYTTGQLAIVDPETGKTQKVGKPAMITDVDPAPDGKYFRVTTMERPFSYLFTYSSFPQREEIWDDAGAKKVELRKRGLLISDEERPKPTDRRAVAWRPDGRGLSFLQTEPADPKNPSKKARDRVMLWLPPFRTEDQQTVWSSGDRISGLQYSPDGSKLFVTQSVEGKTRISFVDPLSAERPVVLSEAKPDDEAVTLLTRRGYRTGTGVRIGSRNVAYLSGTTYAKDPTKDAPRPFIDRVSLTDGKRERLFESRADVYETAVALDDELKETMVTRQSPSMVPNTFLVDREEKEERAVTKNVDYAPDLTQARREWVTVTRPDGFKYQVRVTLPANYVSGQRRPAFFWFYPAEFTGQEAYDKSKRTFNKNLFNGSSPSNKAALIRLGYVLVEPDTPIIGDANRKNDAYVSNLRNDLSATIDELDRRGWIDRTRLAIGGHSYGAFSTANAMIQTPFFKAGIAGDGNYNRSLTPFGFQSEERPIWEGREMYLAMSPILYADQITGALLMYHGLEDQNVGTAPINSERMFAALQANGKPAALYMYPYEDHGQIAKETILDQWARFVAWLEKYLK